jgi:hypothetical protein
MKWDRCDLEGDAGEHEHQAEQLAGRQACAECASDTVIAGGAGEAVNQRDAVEQDAAGKRAEDEILQARFSRTRVAPHEAGEDVGRQRLKFEADVERQQVGCRHHHARAHRGKQDQHRIFGTQAFVDDTVAAEKPWRDDDADGCRGVDQDLCKRPEGVCAIKAVEGGPAIARRSKQGKTGGEQQRNGGDADGARGRVTAPCSNQHEDDCPDRQDQFGQCEKKLVHSACSAPETCSGTAFI